MAPTTGSISDVIFAGSALLDNELKGTASDLRTALCHRLRIFSERRNVEGYDDKDLESLSLQEVQYRTAEAALQTLESSQAILIDETQPSTSSAPPAMGTRDIAQLRTLASIVFKWGSEPCIDYLGLSSPLLSSSSQVSDLTASEDNFRRLSTIAKRVLHIFFPDGLRGKTIQTFVTTTLAQKHLSDILHAAIIVGWLPKSLVAGPITPQDSLRPAVMRLLSMLPSAETMVALGGIMASKSKVVYTNQVCTSLLSRQLLRPDGVRGLFSSVFGEASSIVEADDLAKMEHVAKVLTTVPAKMDSKDYYRAIVPRVISLSVQDETPAHRRAAAFVVSQLLSISDDSATMFVLQKLHEGVISLVQDTSTWSADSSISAVIAVVANTDPSPNLLSKLITPIVVPLYSLLYHLSQVRTFDPTVKESINSLLNTWLRVVPLEESSMAILSITTSGRIYWKAALDGEIRRIDSPAASEPLALFTPEDLKRAEQAGELDPGANLLDLYPDPRHFVAFLKDIDQQDIFAEVFGMVLEAYRTTRQEGEHDPERSLLYLQLIIQMQEQLSDTTSASNLLKKPKQILSFIKHALESARTTSDTFRSVDIADDFANLRLNKDSGAIADLTEDADSDDGMSDSEAFTADDEMTETSVTLLLSILEGNGGLSARTEPLLNDIFELLEPLANDGPSSLRPLCREARMVLTARLASTSISGKSATSKEDDVQEQYQKALKLLQDPILPVRAHGLLLLRQLVSPETTKGAQKRHKPMNPALVPAILSIFLQSIQNDESYIFLNAVQGLAAMTDTVGREILQGLIRDYSRDVEKSGMTQQEVDKRLRIGEALSMVIKRCGSALADYTELFVPSLFRVVQATFQPTTLRTSALSLLTDCVTTYPIAMLPYVHELSEGLIDLLQVETVLTSKKADGEQEEATMDAEPTSTNTKYPPFRRAAIHLFNHIIRETTRLLYEEMIQQSPILNATIQRAKTTLSYVAMVVNDGVLKAMAREGVEQLTQLERAMVGL